MELFFKARGYAISRRTSNFIRLRFAVDPSGALPVDLMLVNEETFGKIQSASLRRDLGNDLTLSIPSALHFIAMKLHALHNAQRTELGTDLQDMPPTKYDDSSNPNSENDRVRESAALFDLPAFDSLPADEGLSNIEAPVKSAARPGFAAGLVRSGSFRRKSGRRDGAVPALGLFKGPRI